MKTDERSRRWSASINLTTGRATLREVRRRPLPQNVVDTTPVLPDDEPAQVEDEPADPDHRPLSPWTRPAVTGPQPQDADRRGLPSWNTRPSRPVRPETANPVAAAPDPLDAITDAAVERVRKIMGLAPEQLPVAPLDEDENAAVSGLHCAGAFMTPPAPASPAGAFVR